MKNRIIALLMMLVLVVMAFASCGFLGGPETPDPGKNPNQGGNNKDDGTTTTGEYPWDTTELRFQMSENSNGKELPSSSKRYLAGNLEGITDQAQVDQDVYDRNEAAYKATKVKVTYTYRDDSSDYAWGQNIDKIYNDVMSYDDKRADMYCNFVYDMVATSLKGSFANLLSKVQHQDDPDLKGKNYFEFAADSSNYVQTYDEDGYATNYMWEYMQWLTLSKWKMYCLSSDYFIDMVRAFLVVPVNVGLLETLQTGDEEWNKDRVPTVGDNGKLETNYTVEDFYALVDAHLWNYETLAKFSAKIAQNEDSSDSQGIDIHDTIGFALGTGSGLSAAGMLYTTTITIIDRVYDTTKKDYVYSYPYTTPVTDASGKVTSFTANGQHEELNQFCDNLLALFNTTGVVAVSPEEASKYSQGEESAKDITGIRNRFATGHILFGGVICLGSLEYAEYKEMNGNGGSGYGIVPVPLYRTKDAQGNPVNDEYQTQIHNLGKIGAISFTTEKFAQCTAFLNYQSTHSTEILSEYYNYKLAGEVGAGGVEQNVDMLKFIRKNVRSSFDKAYEDALGRFYLSVDPTSMQNQWHTMIMGADYKFDQMRTEYMKLVTAKALRLYDLENVVFADLPM